MDEANPRSLDKVVGKRRLHTNTSQERTVRDLNEGAKREAREVPWKAEGLHLVTLSKMKRKVETNKTLNWDLLKAIQGMSRMG